MFKDEIKEIVLPQLEIPKLKGHTKIELTDVHTGKKEVIEHDNAITDGLQKTLRALGAADCTYYRDSNTAALEIWKYLIGGIYLFDTALANNAKFMPAGAQMVANGSYGVANSSNPSELGSFNAIESFSDGNTISLVYDWSTAQGNGNIAAVSLGTAIGGYIGYGNQTSKTAAATRKFVAEQQNAFLNNAITYSNTENTVYAAMVYVNNFVYQSEKSNYSAGTTAIKVFRSGYSITKADIFYKSHPTSFTDFEEYHEFTLPAALSEQYMSVAGTGTKQNCIMLLPSSNKSNGATVLIYVLDLENKTVSTISFTNNTGAAITTNTGIIFVLLDDTYALVQTSSNTGAIYKINYLTGEVIGEATKNGLQNTGQRNSLMFDLYTDSLFLWSVQQQSGYVTYFYDKVKNEFFPTNMDNGWSLYFKNIVNEDFLYGAYRSANRTQNIFAVNNPLRLMTINNLDTPVEKTASKTMKVTYTITRATT